MADTAAIKRKNIDLSVEVLQKLTILAAAQGRSLKNYIETLLTAKANSVKIEVSENPSPSGDPWFEDTQNLEELREAVRQHRQGDTKVHSIDDIRDMLGI